jgi:hypothetical protein
LDLGMNKSGLVHTLPSGRLTLVFISFSPSHLEGNADVNHDMRAHICAWGGEFCQISILCQVGLPNCWRPIFLVLLKLDGCQVDLPNCWNCSKYIFATGAACGKFLQSWYEVLVNSKLERET